MCDWCGLFVALTGDRVMMCRESLASGAQYQARCPKLD